MYLTDREDKDVHMQKHFRRRINLNFNYMTHNQRIRDSPQEDLNNFLCV